MLLNKEKNKIVYLGYYENKVVYVGYGSLSRASSLVENKHHSNAIVDSVEILGPYDKETAMLLESELIIQYNPKYNVNGVAIKENKLRKQRELTETTKNIIEDLKDGIKQTEIAIRYGVSRQHVSNIKSRHI